MRKFNNPRVFDEFLMGTTTYYTSSEFNELLGSADQLAIIAVTDAYADRRDQREVDQRKRHERRVGERRRDQPGDGVRAARRERSRGGWRHAGACAHRGVREREGEEQSQSRPRGRCHASRTESNDGDARARHPAKRNHRRLRM